MVGEGDGVCLADDDGVEFGMVVEVRLRVLRVGVEGDRPAHGICQGSGAVGVADHDDGGRGLPCPLRVAALNSDRRPGLSCSSWSVGRCCADGT